MSLRVRAHPLIGTLTRAGRRAVSRVCLCLALAAAVGGSGCANGRAEERVVYVSEGPPLAQPEVFLPDPGYDAAWVRGHWEHDGRVYYWVPGHWDRKPRPGAAWVQGRWEHDHHGWYWVKGKWE